MLAALERGVKAIILGIGGSATNDGGAGMMQALGVKLLDKDRRPLPVGGSGHGAAGAPRSHRAGCALATGERNRRLRRR